ncbi:MAG: threonylcarbamoyl-AMP synthase [Ruminococcaceae bacterium]|nr:threonylcarbamoyl-AMP synthase [Oscillospiraceae bacterium]
MNTELFHIQDPKGHEQEIAHVADILRTGGLAVFPTETVYGLGGLATSEHAAKAIYEAKGRPSDNPLIIHVAAPEDAEPYAVTSEIYYRLAAQFMPGPLTVILSKKETIPHAVTGGLDTVAVRCPAHPVARALIEAVGAPVAAPSANRSGRPSPTCAAHAIEDLSGRVAAIIDGGECEVGLESTIIKLEGDKGILLRPGAITADALSCVCEVSIAPAVTAALAENERPLSPGMKYRHYAPHAPLVLLDGAQDAVLRYLQNESADPAVGILCYDEELPLLSGKATLFPIGKKEDLPTQARRLFAALREADTHPALTKLYAHLPPPNGLGLALYNRCIRAAAHTVKKID